MAHLYSAQVALFLCSHAAHKYYVYNKSCFYDAAGLSLLLVHDPYNLYNTQSQMHYKEKPMRNAVP